MKVLVAEDDRATLGRIRSLLRQWGHDCIEAGDGLTAWKLIRKERPRLVITDWVMPQMDGLELLQKIRDEISEQVYVIFLTGRDEIPHLVEAMETGADDFIRKPFHTEELRVRVRAGLRMMEQKEALERANDELAMAYLKLQVANGRMKSELQAAAEIQEAFFPVEAPHSDFARFAWFHQPCEAHSGDTFNFLPLDRHRIGLYVANFNGHGVGSALMSAQLNLTLSRIGNTQEPREPSGMGELSIEAPAEVARWLNHRFRYFERLRYFTLLYGVMDFEKKAFRYTSAAHPGPIVISQGRAQIRKLTPPAVGLRSDAQFQDQTVALDSGDRLFFYTDGIFGIENILGREFDEDSLAQLLLEGAHEPLESSLKSAVDQVVKWGKPEPLKDDLCLIGVEVA
jgi:phosphoserine phosphatase RsbU/P